MLKAKEILDLLEDSKSSYAKEISNAESNLSFDYKYDSSKLASVYKMVYQGAYDQALHCDDEQAKDYYDTSEEMEEFIPQVIPYLKDIEDTDEREEAAQQLVYSIFDSGWKEGLSDRENQYRQEQRDSDKQQDEIISSAVDLAEESFKKLFPDMKTYIDATARFGSYYFMVYNNGKEEFKLRLSGHEKKDNFMNTNTDQHSSPSKYLYYSDDSAEGKALAISKTINWLAKNKDKVLSFIRGEIDEV